MRILCTGSSGFIGRALCAEAGSRGWEVEGFDHHRHGQMFDVREPGLLESILQLRPADAVVHLAASIYKRDCEDYPREAIDNNVFGTLVVAQACAATETPLVYCSTSEVYGDCGKSVSYEDDETWPSSGIYGMTKLWGEHVAQAYAPDGLKIIRPTMPYGPGVAPGPGRRALDNLVWQALTFQEMVVHHAAARSWCWIDDLARGIAVVVEHGVPGIYNVGRDDDEVTMHALACRICWHTGALGNQIRIIDPPKRQTPIKRVSCAKLRALGWEPTVGLDEGLPLMVQWVREWLEQQPAA